MFQSEELDNHLKTSNTIQTETAVYAEWNFNDADNVEKLGNYRYRPNTPDSIYSILPNTYTNSDIGNYYTGATDADITIQSGFDDQDQPTLFTTKNEKMNLLYSLEDCIKQNRPRSGINKLLYLGRSANQYLDIGNQGTSAQENISISRRPRYYMASRYDQFKYWTSYRTETVNNEEQVFGLSQQNQNGIYYIDDAAPFVVYKNNVPSNKIVVKMQTNVGDIDFGQFRKENTFFSDPLFGDENKTTPVRWQIQVLQENDWISVISFDQNSLKENGDPIIGSDGYVEISYGLQVPFPYQDVYIFAGELPDESLLPEQAPYGYVFLIKEDDEDKGILKIYNGESWETIIPKYGWSLSSQQVDIRTQKVTKLSNPEYFVDEDGELQFREFQFIRGIRVVVETMNRPECTFDLIEFSPRLVADISEMVSSLSVTKTMSDLGNSSVPVGQILASNGSVELFDSEFAFNSNNAFDIDTRKGSIVSKYVDMRIKLNVYQIIKNVNNYDYFIPLKTLYSEDIPAVSGETGIVSITLRDLFFFLELSKAPEILITNASISYAITLLLDYIGFSNVVFKRIDSVPEIIIPFFFVNPDQNVAEVLQELAIASQTAIFFDEYNNLVVMSKEYLLPNDEERQTDSFLYGNVVGRNLPNIINLSSEEKRVYNEGRIDYTTRYIQREISKQSQAAMIDERYKTYGYKPVLLWEVAGRENLRTKNDAQTQSQGFSLSAMPLNSTLGAEVPVVVNGEIINNIIDIGESVDFLLASHQGYLYANGEIIRYDATEYAISGPSDTENNLVWVKNNQEYQRYFSKLPFNGKMYPTGNLRIYVEPEYETFGGEARLKNGSVKRHGRGQFGTKITEHQAGLDPYWSNNENVRGCLQKASEYLFNSDEYIVYPETSIGIAGKTSSSIPGISFFDSDQFSTSSTRNGVIKNFRANKYYSEEEINYFSTAKTGTVQSSALVFNGPQVPNQIKTADFVSYIYKELPEPYKHFGTRMRIIGKIESTNQKSETAFGAFPIYQTQDLNVDDPEKNIKILGGSGGIAFNLNKETNNGYYFEIAALTQDNVEQYTDANKPSNFIYTILDDPAPSCVNNVVTVQSKTNIEFVVGQKITITGLVDSLDPTDTRTPLNGEYAVTAINTDQKTFQYTIPGAPIANRTSTTGGTVTVPVVGTTSLSNIFFYKIVSDSNGNAIPVKLWSGLGNIIVDDGKFTGQYRFTGEENSTVYDLAAEYVENGNARIFYLYINGNQVATVRDENPIPEYNNMALFIRGSSRCMFENIYAIGANISQNSSVDVTGPISKVFGGEEINASESLRKYAISGVIQKTYLSGINSEGPPSHILYFDEFGTIMREAVYLDIKYDRAFPAIYSRLMKTLNRLQGYVASGFYGGSYGADFLVFNCLDTTVNLDDTTGNFLRIQGIAFTQSTTRSLTVDDFYKRRATLSDPIFDQDRTLIDPSIEREEYNRIINSRTKYGVNEFNITSTYIQTDDAAEEIFGWIIDKTSKPKILVGLNTFATQNLQLGDIVQVHYKNNDDLNIIVPPEKRFVIYNIEYSKNLSDEQVTIYLVEV